MSGQYSAIAKREESRLGSSKEVRPVSEFDGKIALVTGCARARGIGRAISVAFARAGAAVVLGP